MQLKNELSPDHLCMCFEAAKDFLHSKRQRPEGVIDVKTGNYKDTYVWAGARVKNMADTTEPGKYEGVN